MKNKAELKNKIESLKNEVNPVNSNASKLQVVGNILKHVPVMDIITKPMSHNLAYQGSKIAVRTLGKKYIKNKAVETVLVAATALVITSLIAKYRNKKKHKKA